jgi:hypothetical protein
MLFAADTLEPSLGAYMDAARLTSDEVDRVERMDAVLYSTCAAFERWLVLMNVREGRPHLGQGLDVRAPSQVCFPTVRPFYHHEIVTHSTRLIQSTTQVCYATP